MLSYCTNWLVDVTTRCSSFVHQNKPAPCTSSADKDKMDPYGTMSGSTVWSDMVITSCWEWEDLWSKCLSSILAHFSACSQFAQLEVDCLYFSFFPASILYLFICLFEVSQGTRLLLPRNLRTLFLFMRHFFLFFSIYSIFLFFGCIPCSEMRNAMLSVARQLFYTFFRITLDTMQYFFPWTC